MNANRAILVLGASGDMGSEAARQLRDSGWTVRAMKRGLGQPVEQRDGMTWVRGDAMNRADVEAAAQGCAVILHAVNPPGYRKWRTLVMPMLENTLAAADRTGATVLVPGNVYNFGPDAFPLLAEDSPQHPLTEKGQIRVQMEQRLLEFTRQGGRVIIVRAGDFFGPHSGNNWFAQSFISAGKPVRVIRNPGPGAGHLWSYLPDVASTMVRLLARRESLDPYAVFHMAGHWDATGNQMAEAVARTVDRRTGKTPRIANFPWWLVRLATPFNETIRELFKMRYLWRENIAMDNSRLTALLGEEPHTPLDVAVETTLVAAGCLPAGTGRSLDTVPGRSALT